MKDFLKLQTLRNEVFNMEEIWKAIPQYPTYQASNLGNIRRVTKDAVEDVRPFMNADGYLQIKAYGGHRKYPYVARLVAEAFYGVHDDSMRVDHLNNMHNDNRSENLEWVTQGENLRRAKLKNKCPKGKQKVLCHQTNIIYDSISDAAKSLNLRYYSVYGAMERKKPIHGYTFERVE